MDRLEEKNYLSVLLELYGGLLTDRQREFLELHVNEDLSLGEIAEAHGISRQAVHDAISHGRKSLERFEAHLGLMKLGHQPAAASDSPSPTNEDVIKTVKEISALITEDLLYDTEPLKRKIEKLKRQLGID